jgi:hypothetical protein
MHQPNRLNKALNQKGRYTEFDPFIWLFPGALVLLVPGVVVEVLVVL